MRTFVLALLSSLTLIGGVAAAHAEPGWCKSAEGKVDANGFDDVFEDDARDAVFALVGSLCFSDSEARAAAGKLEAARQAWSRKLAMSDAD